jgi:WD40 repeat protein
MAQVVCQVRARPGRVSFIWSEGKAYFPPYHLDGPKATELAQLGEQARQLLGQIAGTLETEAGPRGLALAGLGQRLFRLVLENGEVESWLARLNAASAVDSLEVLGDHEILPWHVLYGMEPDSTSFGAGGTGWGQFWGMRYNLAAGRRASPVRAVRLLEEPAVLTVVDPSFRDGLPEGLRQRFPEFIAANHLALIESLPDLEQKLRVQIPDLLFFFCRSDGDALLLSGARLTAAGLEELLRQGTAGVMSCNQCLAFVNASSDPAQRPGILASQLSGLGLGGLLMTESAVPAEVAATLGLDFLAGFLFQGEPAGRLLQQLRKRHGPRGLAYANLCPPRIRVAWQTDNGAENRAQVPAEGVGGAQPEPLPDWPYRPLLPYDREDRALFVGREEETAQVAALLDTPGTRIVVVHGQSGVGKSSLLRAGVLPYLEEEAVGYLALRDRSDAEEGSDDQPVIAVRATNDLAGQLALALAAFVARPWTITTPVGGTVTVDLPALVRQATQLQVVDADALRAALAADPALLGRLLSVLAEGLPWEPVLLIEQGEEILTLARKHDDAENQRVGLAMLRQAALNPGQGKVLMALRTEYYGSLINRLHARDGALGAISDFLLTVPDEESMLAAALRPTVNEPVPFSIEIPFARYRFQFEDGLAAKIVREVRDVAATEQESPLSLLQVVCAQLAELVHGRPDRVIREADRKNLGGVQGATSRLVENLIRTLQQGSPATGPTRKPSHRAKYLADFHDILKSDSMVTAVASRSLKYLTDFFRFGGSKIARETSAVLSKLYQLQPDGTVTRNLVSEDQLTVGARDPDTVTALIDRGSDEDVALFETFWLGPPGGQKRHVSLSCDALAPVIARWDREEKVRREHGRKVTIDWLWIVVPLGLLVVVLGWYWYQGRANLQQNQAKHERELGQKLKELQEYQRAIDADTWLLYLSHMAQAEEAWQQKDLVGLRQLLLSHRESPRTEKDPRGFEWYHLWLLADRSRATLFGHPGRANGVALSTDGKLVASGGADGLVHVWNAGDGSLQREFAGHSGPVHAVAFAENGSSLASGGEDGNVFLWRLGENKKDKGSPVSLKGHAGPIHAIVFLGSKKIASAGQDGTIKLWDVGKEKARQSLNAPAPILALAAPRQGGLLASASKDGTILLWDPSDGKKLAELGRQPGPVHALSFDSKGKTLAAGGQVPGDHGPRGLVTFWDVGNRKEKQGKLLVDAPVLCVAFSADGSILATGGKDKAVRLWDVSRGKEKDIFRGHLGWVSTLAYSEDGKTLVSGSYDSTVKLWAPENPGARQILNGLKGGAAGVAISPDDRYVASAGQDGGIRLWKADTGQLVRTLKGQHGPAVAVAFALKDRQIILAAAHRGGEKQEGTIVVWDAEKGEILHTLEDNLSGVTCLALVLDGSRLAAGGAGKEILVWELEKGKVTRKLTGQDAGTKSLAFSSSGRFLASGDARGQIRVWQTDAGNVRSELTGFVFPIRHGEAVTALAFAPDEKELVSGSLDGTVKRWDRAEGKLAATMRGHAGPVLAIAFSPGGDTVVTGGADRTVRLWTLGGEQRFQFPGHAGAVTGVAFSSDRGLLASASQDGVVRLWRAAPVESERAHGQEE